MNHILETECKNKKTRRINMKDQIREGVGGGFFFVTRVSFNKEKRKYTVYEENRSMGILIKKKEIS